jgi:uncharacterized protein
VDVLFLDANVLFSAAYSPDARLRLFWEIPSTRLVTSLYAAEEARRNLTKPDQRKRLELLVAVIRQVAEANPANLPADILLPEKDRPILAAAIASGATHLITGDRAHFGVWYGKRIGNLLVLPPAAYVDERHERQRLRREQRKQQEPG